MSVDILKLKTLTGRIRPPMASHSLDLPTICDVCGKGRSTRRHTKCSQIRQQRESIKWESYMANVAAKKVLGRRA
ncbi:hypothetical protein DM813_25825 [Pseudomonas alkylphenolica]|uniref:Uncharacterized protein n=1 Tax=Pseudomonas alkylphenolica TaxID=237609 RepID=A0A443ZH80_9PSED|nr:hypothetical protein [Pseudomonas alkylphenolica]RWU18085.1 hypothetical protein DM813_25825 [Pseudomonas alkylphenolica]